MNERLRRARHAFVRTNSKLSANLMKNSPLKYNGTNARVTVDVRRQQLLRHVTGIAEAGVRTRSTDQQRVCTERLHRRRTSVQVETRDDVQQCLYASSRSSPRNLRAHRLFLPSTIVPPTDALLLTLANELVAQRTTIVRFSLHSIVFSSFPMSSASVKIDI